MWLQNIKSGQSQSKIHTRQLGPLQSCGTTISLRFGTAAQTNSSQCGQLLVIMTSFKVFSFLQPCPANWSQKVNRDRRCDTMTSKLFRSLQHIHNVFFQRLHRQPLYRTFACAAFSRIVSRKRSALRGFKPEKRIT